jgi:hypothetical protein
MFSTALVSVSALIISNSVDAGLVGLLMTYTITVTGSLVRVFLPQTDETGAHEIIELVGKECK